MYIPPWRTLFATHGLLASGLVSQAPFIRPVRDTLLNLKNKQLYAGGLRVDNEPRLPVSTDESSGLEGITLLACKCGNKTWFLRDDQFVECPFCESTISIDELFSPKKLAS